LHQQNPPVLNWKCRRLRQVDLSNGRKTDGSCSKNFEQLSTPTDDVSSGSHLLRVANPAVQRSINIRCQPGPQQRRAADE